MPVAPVAFIIERAMAIKAQPARETFDGTGARFIIAELDLAITFCQGALTSRSASRKDRNAENAERALDAVARLRQRIRLTQEEEKEVTEKTSTLTSLLEQLKSRRSSAEDR
jgi:hypothetical protein